MSNDTAPRKLEWVLGGLLAIILLLVIGFLFFYWNRSQSDITPTKPYLTAREAYEKVEPTARQWADDAQLAIARTTWDRTSEGLLERGGWSMTFYSPQRQAIALFAVNPQAVTLISDNPAASRLNLADISVWAIDSPTVADDFFSAITADFLDQAGASTFVMALQLGHEQPAWTASLTSLDDEHYFWLKLDATTGITLDIQQIP